MELTMQSRHLLYEFIKKVSVIHKMNMSDLSKRCSPVGTSNDREYIHNVISSETLDTITKTLISVSGILDTLSPIYFLHDVLHNNYTKRWNKIQLKYHQVIDKRNRQKYNYLGVLRRSKGIPATDFAKRLGVGYTDIHIIETCKRPNISTIIKAAPILGMSIYDLGKKFDYNSEQITNTIKVTSSNSICHYLYTLRKQHGYTQKQLAKLLGMAQTKISTMEALRPPALVTLMKLSEVYSLPIFTLLHKHPRYKGIEKDSPAYEIIELCMNKHMTPNKLSNKVGDINNSINYVISKLQHRTDHIDINIANKLINVFNLPTNYFGKIVDKQFIASFNRFKYNNPKLTELDFGYRLAKVRYKYHLTLIDLGKKLHLTRERIRQYEMTKRLNISYKTLKSILKIFPSREIKYLKGDYHYLNEVFNDNTKAVIDKGAKELATNPKFKVGDFFKYLYHTLHMNNKTIANVLNSSFNRLFYDGIKPHYISYAKTVNYPVEPLAMKLADVFNLSLLNLLHESPKYNDLEPHSPSYKIFKLSFNNNVPKIEDLSKYIHIVPRKIRNICLHSQYDGDPADEKILNKLIRTFHLPKDYFVKGIHEKDNNVKSQSKTKTYNNLYRAVIDIYLSIIKLLVMDHKNLKAIKCIDQLDVEINKSKNVSLIYLICLYLKLLTIVSIILQEYKISNNKIHDAFEIWSIRLKYVLLRQETLLIPFAYKHAPNLSRQVAGELNDKYASLFIKWINFYRDMFNLPKIKLNNRYCKDIQYGVDELTLMNKGVHHGFVNLNRPDSVSKDDWTIGSRATMASIISNISTDPGTLIFKYLANDFDDEHGREWFLDKGLQEIGVGQTKAYNGLLVMTTSDLNNKDNYSNSVLSFPNQGVFPFECVKNGKWGLYLPKPPYGDDLYSDIQRDGLNIHVHDNTDDKFVPVSNISIENLLNYGYYIGISYSVYNTKVNHNYSIKITGIPHIDKYSYNVTLFTLKM